VDLRDALFALVAPLRQDDAIVAGVCLTGATAETGMRLVFDIEGERLDIEVAPADAEVPAATMSGRLRFAYVARGPRGRARGMEVCEAVAQHARANEETVLRDLAAGALAPTSASRIRTVHVSRLLEEASDGARRFHTLSPYVGCLIGCRFCYAQSHVAVARRFAGLPQVAWGSYVDVRANAAEVLKTELAELDVQVIKFCPIVSDPYQAAEERHGVTRACLETIARAERRVQVVVLTRARLIERDAALLGRMQAYAGVSLPTVDEEARAHFEPRAASIEARLATLETLRGAGVRTFAVVQPLLPGPVEALADALAERCASVRLGVLEGVEGAAGGFREARYAEAATEAWQAAQARALGQALQERGVALWSGELPPGVGGS
jgi:DNA repair photolyase